ncbi:MAG TPA: Hsp20/alpha crystallin family protein [Acetobacteraceae bacterium]|nr:Hsp20/alpha crystallin family protein [Acetobacteraceae bacterium]
MAERRIDPWGRGRTTPASRFTEEGNPFFTLYREMNRTFDEFLRGIDLPMFGRAGGSGTWPHVDVTETDKEVKVVAELPGMEEKDIEVTLADGVLTLQGEKKSESEGAVHRERWHGAFRRSIQLGPEVDPEKVSASFKNGVLTVTLGKREEAQRQVKRIPIGGSETAGGPGTGR